MLRHGIEHSFLVFDRLTQVRKLLESAAVFLVVSTEIKGKRNNLSILLSIVSLDNTEKIGYYAKKHLIIVALCDIM